MPKPYKYEIYTFIMPTEKIMHRTGQILGTEKIPCQICKKDTDQNIVYFYAKRIIRASAIGGGAGVLIRELVNRGRFNVSIPDIGFIGYVCNECKSLSVPKEQRDIKKKYGWSRFWGFKGKPKEDIKFKVWKI